MRRAVPPDRCTGDSFPAALTVPPLEFGGVADGFGAFQEASRSAGGDPCAAGLLIALPEQGHALLAGAVAKGHRQAA